MNAPPTSFTEILVQKFNMNITKNLNITISHFIFISFILYPRHHALVNDSSFYTPLLLTEMVLNHTYPIIKRYTDKNNLMF